MSAPTNQIRQAYDQAVTAYNQDRVHLRTQKYVTQFINELPPQAEVLDLGCGAGTPVDDLILKKGHLVTGLDISAEQLKLARHNCPRAAYILRDLTTLHEHEFQVDGIVCMYTIFHLPRKMHGEWLKILASYLVEGGSLLISFGERDFEGWHDFFGQKIWSSQYSSVKNSELLTAAGFEIKRDEIDTSGREQHQIVLARKK